VAPTATIAFAPCSSILIRALLTSPTGHRPQGTPRLPRSGGGLGLSALSGLRRPEAEPRSEPRALAWPNSGPNSGPTSVSVGRSQGAAPGRQPAAMASASVQNQRLPLSGVMRIWAYQGLQGMW